MRSGSSPRTIVTLLLLVIAAAVASAQSEVVLEPDVIVADAIDARDVEISRFGTYIAIYDTTEGNSVRVFDRDLNQLWRHRLRLYWAGSLQQGSVLEFAPDESFVLFPSFRTENDVCVCDTATGEPIDVLRAHEESVDELGLSADASWLVTASYKELVLWRREGGSFAVADRIDEFDPAIHSIEFLPDNRRVAISTTRESTIRSIVLYDTADATLEEIARYEFRDNNISNDIDQLAISPDGAWLAAGYSDSLLIFDLRTPGLDVDQRIDGIDLGRVSSLGFAPDSSMIVTGHFGYLRWWRLASGRWVEVATNPTQQPIAQDIAIASDGTALLLASRADENALSRFTVRGVAGSPLGLIIGALDGELSPAQRAVLSDELARELLDGLADGALDERDMFETQAEYEQRLARARTQIRTRIAEEIEDAFGAERISNEAAMYDVVVPLEGQGSYDVDRRRYALPALADVGSLFLDRDTARALFRSWQDAAVVATRFERDSDSGYADFRLAHPVDAIEYPLIFDRNPFTGELLDAASSVIPAIAAGPDLVIRDLRVDAIFPTLYQRYANDPVGTFRIENVGSGIVSDLRITFAIGGLTGSAQVVATPESLASGQGVDARLTAPIGSSVLDEAEGGTATMTIDVSYRRFGEARSETITRQIRLMNRNAIQWSDDRRIGAFMSVSQGDLLAWTGRIAGSVETEPTPVLTRNFLYAVQIFESLRLAGIEYVVDPNSAYQRLSENERAVDYLRFPVETITNRAGDCDDLSVLYATMLEAVGVPTAFITTPGHIFVAIDAGIDPTNVDRAFTSAENLIVRDGSTWLPVETTALTEGFVRAWQIGGLQWRQANAEGTAGFFTAQEAWSAYPPVGVESRATVPVPDAESTRLSTRGELAAFRDLELEPKLRSVRAQTANEATPQMQNRLGVLHASYGLLEDAASHFRAALGDGEYVPAMINLANVLSIEGRHDEAQSLLARAREREPENARVLMGLAFSLWESGDRDEARTTWEVASRVSPSLARRYPLFGQGASDTGARAGAEDSLFSTDWAESE